MPYADIGPITLFYEKEGLETPALVFVHGITCDHADWTNQVSFFGKKNTLIVADQYVDCGRSTRSWPVSERTTALDD